MVNISKQAISKWLGVNQFKYLGYAIMATTAKVYDLTLVTRNIDNFQWIKQLKLLNPFDNFT